MKIVDNCRAIAVAINSLHFNPNLSDVEIQSYELALAEIRDYMAQQKEEENEPLTAADLDNLVKQPIFFVPVDGSGVKARWVIYNGFPISAKSPLDKGQIYIYYFRGDYGVRWLAYRHPPKEELHES